MKKQRTMWCCAFLTAVLGLRAIPAVGQERLYVKKDSLTQSLLATKAQLQAWQQGQEAARQTIKIGPWLWAAVGVGEKLDGLAATQAGVAPGTPGWVACPSDNTGTPTIPTPADYLYTTITAEQPVKLTIELSRLERFGGFAYRPPPSNAGVQPADALLWLNGRQVVLHDRLDGYARVPVAKRQGWHEVVLVDLSLERGANRLAVALNKGADKSWFTTVRLVPQPVHALWAMIEHDFPRSGHRLLELVDARWFDAAAGWLAEGDEPRCEPPFVQSQLERLAADGAMIRSRLEALTAAKVPASDPRWMNLCVTAAELRASLKEAASLRAAIETLANTHPERYAGPQLLARTADLRRRILERAADRLDPSDEPTRNLFAELRGLQREALVDQNPMLAGKQLLFVKRYAYDSDHFYDEFVSGIRRFGGGLCVLSLADGRVTEIAPQLRDGVFDRYDLSFDGQRILFNYKPPKPVGFRVFEIGVDGSGLRQVTFPPADEPQRIAQYATCSLQELEQNPTRYGHWTDDMHPCYLPDGRIVFTSTRTERSVLCGGHGLTVTNLHRINADGSGLHLLSQGALSEFCPTVMHDGRILYNRWEYVDKGAGAVQSLWAMAPDGRRGEEIYGNNISTPPVYNQAQHVPGANNLVVCLGAGHAPGNMGAILLIDLHKNKRTTEAMTALTPGSVPKGNWALRQFRNGRWMTDVYGPWYCSPYPLAAADGSPAAGKFFLVSCNPEGLWNEPAGYGLYLLDVFGNRVPIYHDSKISCWQARPLEPRPTPPILPDATPPVEQPEVPEATLLVSDVYQGLEGVAPGTVKYLRVMEQVPRPWSVWHGYQPNDASPGEMVAISLYTHLSIKVLHGIVPVQPDGSAHFTVPAQRSIFLQALDENFMEVQRMRTFVNYQPGEHRSCIGCHEHRSRVPVNRRPLALDDAPAKPQAQPGETAPRPLHYPTDIQPIFDRHCVSCHGPQKKDGDLDLSGALTTLFNRSYEDLIRKDSVHYIQEFVGPKPEGADAMGYAAAVPPYTYGSHRAKLISVLRAGHYEAKLSREEFIRLVTWVDANAPYYGSYFGRRNLAHRDQPDFRPVPTLESACGLAPFRPAAAK